MSLQSIVRSNMVDYLVGRAITCPRTGEVLDARTVVVFAAEATAVGTSPDARLAHLGLTVDPLSVK